MIIPRCLAMMVTVAILAVWGECYLLYSAIVQGNVFPDLLSAVFVHIGALSSITTICDWGKAALLKHHAEEQGQTVTMDLNKCDCARCKRLRRSHTAPPASQVICEGDIIQLTNGQHGKVLPANSGGGSFFVPADSLQSFLKEREQP